MRDDGLVEPFAVDDIFVDGFTKHEEHNGVMSCVGFLLEWRGENASQPVKVVRVRLRWPAGSTDEAIADAQHAQVAVAPRISKVARPRRH